MVDLKASLAEIGRVITLTERGRFSEVIEHLAPRDPGGLECSPTLALYYGIAHGKLGRHATSARWVEEALERARERGDHALYSRALNVRGAIALERGDIDAAAGFFSAALAKAEEINEHGTVGRCSNNLGIIANLRGMHRRALASYTMALAAFQRAGQTQGVAETEHNVRISYRDLGDYRRALEASDRAVYLSQEVKNRSLTAFAIGGRAEIRTLLGQPDVAIKEIRRAIDMHEAGDDRAGRAEDLRVLAMTEQALGRWEDAEDAYREAISAARAMSRPMLLAEALRGLAVLLVETGRAEEALEVARTARASFNRLGARAEIHRLDLFIDALAG